MLNTQPIQKFNKQQPENQLSVHSIFYTIQGEGPFTGQPAIFIRLAGCNLQCPGCDTEYLTDEPNSSIADIITRMATALEGNDVEPLVVITGGEPFRQDITLLLYTLNMVGLRVQVETNGTLPPNDEFNNTGVYHDTTIVCSPKTGSVNEKLLPYINAYKYVLTEGKVNPDDGLPVTALGHPAKPMLARPHEDFEGDVYLQPMDEQDVDRNHLNLQACIDSCVKHGYTLQVQLHKIIGME